jgi:CDP-glycerol glycerophosphotransferase (TagB/SpsB family)
MYYKDLIKSKFTFLQHGVTKEDMSEQFDKKEIDCLITAVQREYNSFVDNNIYSFTQREVCLTGFPRYDSLLSKTDKHKNIILVMPTWRAWLIGESISKGDKRTINSNFFTSDYAFQWKSFLHSRQLKKLLETQKYKLIFFPHPNVQPYLEWFNLPSWIITENNSDISIQEFFSMSSFLITDYSSVAFDMALLAKETIYFQFDKDKMFNGKHGRKKGYFSYEQDGFGPVCETKRNLLNVLEKMIQENYNTPNIYLKRMQSFFTFYDTNNSKRVYNVISNMDNS